MNIAWIICKKELRSYFFSPMAYVIMGAFVFMMGWMFFNFLVLSKETYSAAITGQVLRPIFGNMNFLLMLVCPLVTMRQFAEEKQLHTMQLLLTSPISDWQIWLGKFLSSVIFVLVLVSTTFIFPLILAFAGYSNWPVIFTCYLGLFFNILVFVSVGLFASSLTNNQLVAALISFCLLFSVLILILTANATENPLVGQIFQYLSTAFHYEGFSRGVVKSFNLVYYASFVGFMAYLSLISLRSRNW